MSGRVITVGVDERIFVYESVSSEEKWECISSMVTNVGDPAGLLPISDDELVVYGIGMQCFQLNQLNE